MATTTNFGWETPDDTDLVKDGAAAIRTALGGVDTSFVDLKGGTTGQVLAKASGTDLDFSWVAVDPLTILDAKGDLITATAADTPARLAVGTNGQTLMADSSTATGLKWATASSGGSLTLLSTTSMSGTSTTVSSISGAYTNLLIVLYGLSPASTTSPAYVYPNGSSTISDSSFSTAYGSTSTTEANKASGILWNGGQNFLGGNANNGASILIYNYANTNIAYKTFSFQGRSTGNLSPSTLISAGGGAIATSSAITSLQFGIGSASTTGTILIYGVN